MAMAGMDNAADIAAAEVKGIGLPTPTLEKQIAMENKGAFPQSVQSSDDEHEDPDFVRKPTEEELHTLRRVPARIPWIAFTVAFVELCERFAYYGTTAVMINFIQQPLPDGSTTGNDPRPNGQPGALDYGQRAATGASLFNRFWAYFIPLIGGYLADARWGRLKTIYIAIGIALFGHVIIIVAAIPGVIKNPDGAIACFFVGLLFFATGVGGFKPNISPLYAEQLSERRMHVLVLPSGEAVIVDPSMTTQRMFMYFYFCINVGSIVGQVSMVYAERYVGFWLSFFLPTIMFMFCPFVLLAMHKKYNLREPTDSVFGKFLLLTKHACSEGGYKHIGKKTFWERVKPSVIQVKPTWMTFDDAWVDEIARGVKACSVFLFYPLWWLAYNQIDNNLVSQAATMSLHGVPNDLLNNLNPLGIIIMIPIMDRLVYPALRKAKIRFTPLRRMCASFFVAMAAMIWAAVVQYYIYDTGACGHYMNTCERTLESGEVVKLVSPLNVWTQSGAYVLVGLAEILGSITGLEYAYTKAPANMRSLVFGLYNFTSALSAALGQAFVGLAADPLLIWNYGAVAIIAFVTGIAFYFVFTRPWDPQEEEMNMLKESEYKGHNLGGTEKKMEEADGPAPTTAPEPQREIKE